MLSMLSNKLFRLLKITITEKYDSSKNGGNSSSKNASFAEAVPVFIGGTFKKFNF